ncbi:MAG: fibronectin type III domain-containing protein [Planctomycetota bacterium]
MDPRADVLPTFTHPLRRATALHLGATLLCLVAGTACGGHGGGPPAPTARTVSGIDSSPRDGWALLRWNPIDGASGYRVYRGDGEAFDLGVATAVFTTTDHSANIRDVDNDAGAHCAVTAILAGEETAPVFATVTGQELGAPDAPTDVTAAADDGSIRLDWPDVPGALGYRVYEWAAAPVAATARNLVVAPTASTTVITGLANDVETWFVVTAVNGGGESAPSLELAVTPTAQPAAGPPPAPQFLQSAAGNAIAYLSWPTATTATHYAVYMSTAGPVGQQGTMLGTIASPPAQVSGLTNGQPVRFAVTAWNAYGESEMSPETTVTPTSSGGNSNAVPPAPTNLQASPSGTSVQLHWGQSAGAVFYFVYASTTPAIQPGSSVRLLWTTGTSTTVVGLHPGTTYYFAVTAVGFGGESQISNAVAVGGGTGSGGNSAWHPNHGLFTGTWQTSLFNGEISIAYYQSLDSYQVWWVKHGYTFYNNACTYQRQMSTPQPIGPNNTFSFHYVDPSDPSVDVTINGHFIDATHVSGYLSDVNGNVLGCNPPAQGNFSAVWHP